MKSLWILIASLSLFVACSQTATGTPVTSIDSSTSGHVVSTGSSSSSVDTSTASSTDPKTNLGKYASYFVWIKGGTFTRTDGVIDSISGFYMMKTEVSQALFISIMAKNPSAYTNVAYPVEYISWNDATSFCNAISKALNFSLTYSGDVSTLGITSVRLPTEAEWEYAARAGSTSLYSWGDQTDGTLPSTYTNPVVATSADSVGKRSPNAFGLYDMQGNVWEWTNDWFGALDLSPKQTNPTGAISGSTRVIRGGGFDTPLSARSFATANRANQAPNLPKADLGFRVVVAVKR